MTSDPAAILIVRLGSMGDIVHALPVLSSLRSCWPAARIDWLVEPRHLALLELVEGVAERIVVDTRRIVGKAGWLATIAALRRRRYDIVIDAQGLIKSALLARASGAARVIGFDRAHAREGVASWFYTSRVDPGAARHVVDLNLALVRQAGVSHPRRSFGLRVPPPRLSVQDALGTIGPRFAVLNPGAAWPNKRWPADRFGQLAVRMQATHALPSLLLWGPGERDLAEAIYAHAPETTVIAPETSLGDVVAVLSRATVVVSGDTGPLHIACAVGTPVVGIFGPTDPARNGPWSPDDVSVSRSAQCECSHARRCHAARWCLEDLGVDEIERAVSARLSRVARSET